MPVVKKDLLLNALFLQRAVDLGIDSNPGDFASLSLKAMLEMQEKDKPNLVYKWSRCLHNSEGKSSIDMDRMPFGLMQYCIEFFSCTHVSQVSNQKAAAAGQRSASMMAAFFAGSANLR